MPPPGPAPHPRRRLQRMTAPAEASASEERPLHQGSGARLRFGVVGCGDVAHRRYLPALAEHRASVEVVACCDPQPDAAEKAIRAIKTWSKIGRASCRERV